MPPAGVAMSLGEAIDLSFYAGLALALRLPVALFPDVEDQAGATAAYFWGKGRFLFPETGLAFSWRVGERVDLVLSSEVFFPVYHLWDGENRPALDEAIITTSVGLSFHL